MPDIDKQNINVIEGVISKVSDDAGVAYIISRSLNEQFIFSFNKIVNYTGESASEMGLKPGRRVNFVLKDNNIVQTVQLL